MPDLAALKAIRGRLAAATGPSYALDCDLADATGYDDHGLTYQRRVDPFGKSDAWETRRSLPRVTESIDAAVALINRVLPGWRWSCGSRSVTDDAWVAPDRNGPDAHLLADYHFILGFSVERMPPGNVPLALLEALFDALIAKAELEGGK